MIPKSKTATAFRADLYETLKIVSTGDPIVITQRENGNVVVISQEKFNEVLAENETLRAISAGVADIQAGRTVDHKKVVSRLKKLQKEWK
jgi:prevent-host-death family protein